MTRQEPEHLDRVFSALAHPIRRAILEQCSVEQQSVAQLAAPHSMSLNAISKHIKALEAAELISREREGNFHRIRTQPATLKPVFNWLNCHVALWDKSLLALKTKMESSA